jgi:hypothetical protein
MYGGFCIILGFVGLRGTIKELASQPGQEGNVDKEVKKIKCGENFTCKNVRGLSRTHSEVH